MCYSFVEVQIMTRRKSLSTVIIVTALFVLSLMTSSAMAQDGRINQQVWSNGWGAVAMYCHNADNQAAGNYVGGGMIGLDQNGQEVLSVDAAAIAAGLSEAAATNVPVLLFSGDIYSLYAEPNGSFSLYSIPDAEGKTFIANWNGCGPVSYPVAPPPPPAPPKPPVDPCVTRGGCCNGKDSVTKFGMKMLIDPRC
jgi:hypothetical protein